ncbi:MAG: hypothetical protein E6G93_13365 [Alphaproteobacteria bacterium]|nr:MAG: hypothetical protein E6G93_13365 [Alphaproteobacteria bacterium]TMK49312.1 MAG: hypothetical protein E6G70_09170 [Alphaproteobacteria bacterium]
MTKFALVGVATILSTALAAPSLAQAIVQAPGSNAFYHPNGDFKLGPIPTPQRQEVAPRRGPANATALAPCFHPSMAGTETTTRPWSAPVGHRQPRAVDVGTSVPQGDLDQEDVDVDRKISSVCRGC